MSFVRFAAATFAAGLVLASGGAYAGKRGSKSTRSAPATKASPAQPDTTPVEGPEAPFPDATAPPPGGSGAPSPPPPPPESDQVFLATASGSVVLFPTARLQIDAAFFPRQTPKSGAYLRRARAGLAGWLGRLVYFDLSVDATPPPPGGSDSVAPAALSPADEYLAFAPAGDRFFVEVGQFDVPFTLENRTSDAYTPFIERSMAVRLLGAPRNKDLGAMLHGFAGEVLYYSAGIFNGDGPGFRVADNQPDFIGRVVGFPFRPRGLALGASGWYGHRVSGAMFPLQATPGGVRFFSPHWITGQIAPTAMELREEGRVTAFAGELTVPFDGRFGARGEGVYKRQALIEADVSRLPSGPLVPVGTASLEGIAAYGEVWYWVKGDDGLLPPPGLELPRRLETSGARPFEDGLMVALRGEILKEDLTVPSEQQGYGDPNKATTRVISGTAGVNYWRGRLVRLSLNYTLNYWSGTSETIKLLRATGTFEHELLLRAAMSL